MNKIKITCLISSILFNFVTTFAQTINIYGPDTVCEGSLETYTADLVSGTYHWLIGNGSPGLSSSNTINVLWGNAGTGSVNVYVTDSIGDTTHIGILYVEIGPKPEPVITADFNSACFNYFEFELHNGDSLYLTPDTCFKACDSSYVTYMVNNTAGSSWQWFVTGAISFTPNGNEVVVLWGAKGVGWVKVVETNSFGCSDSLERCVRVIERPQAAFSSLPATVNGVINICLGQTVFFNNQSTGTSYSPIMDWYWDFGDPSAGPLNNSTSPYGADFTYNSAGIYTVNLIVTNMCNCKDTATVTVIVDSLRTPIIECAGTVCAGDTVTYTTPGICSTYLWSVNGGSIISGGGTNNNFVVVVWGNGSSGNGTVGLGVPGCTGFCDIPNYLQIPIVSTNVNITGPVSVCEWTQVQYTVPLMPGTNYTWSIIPSGNAVVVHGQGTNEIVVQVNDNNFDLAIVYTNLFLGCSGGDTISVSVQSNFVLDGPVEACEGEGLNFTATSSLSNVFTWEIINVNTTNTVSGPTVGTGSFNIPSWTFGPGDFIVSATNTSGVYCNSTELLYITIHPIPPLPDPAIGEILICPEQAYEYNAEPTDPNFYIKWEITGGSPDSATGNTISVLWDATGPYMVSVAQVGKNEPYCQSGFVDLVVDINYPHVDTIQGEDTICTNTIWTYTTTADVENYKWIIVDETMGSVVTGQGTDTVEILWHNTAGNATIMLIGDNCGLKDTFELDILLIDAITPVITALDTACAGIAVQFSTNITNATSWYWDFDDGNSSTSPSPQYTFNNLSNNPITYNVTVKVQDPEGCIGTFTSSHLIIIEPQPLATISTPDPLLYCTGSTISTTFYLPQATGYTYQWYLDGVPISGATSSSYTATSVGQYLAGITNGYGCSSITAILEIKFINCPTCTSYPGASVSIGYSINSPHCSYVTFTPNISSPGTIISIAYGDGTSGTNLNHTYDGPGYFNVAMLVDYGSGYCVEVATVVVHIPIFANFQFGLECLNENEFTVNFEDLSTYVGAAINDWDWTIAVGTTVITTVNDTSLVSVPLAPGTYKVTLEIGNSNNDRCTIMKTIVIPHPASAAFGFSSPVCEQTPTMQFTDQSLGDIIHWVWDFGDGAGSLLKDPDRTYDGAQPNYIVTLTVTDKYGCTSFSDTTVTINDNDIDGFISPSYLGICNGTTGLMSYFNTSGSNILSYEWSNNSTTSSIAVSQTGNYTVTVTDNKGCTFTTAPAVVQEQNIPYPLIVGALNYCQKDTIRLNANQGLMYNYEWFFNGSPVSSTHLLEVIATATGTFPVQVILSDGTCSDTAFVNVTVHAVPAHPHLLYNPSDPLCEDEPILVTAANNMGLLHNWSTGQYGASITVYNAGLYVVTVTDSYGCTNSTTFNIHPQPNIDWFISGCYEFCDTVPITIPGSIEEYEAWELYQNGVGGPGGGGNVPTIQLGTLSPGTYIFQYLLVTTDGCEIWTEPLEITIKQCPCECISVEFEEIKCYQINAAGEYYYKWQVLINLDCAENATFTVYSPQGAVSTTSSALLQNGPNVISGIFKDALPTNTELCLLFSISYEDRICDFSTCRELPECQITLCSFEITEPQVVCMGQDSLGQNVYNFSFIINSAASYEILITSNYGSISGYVNYLAPGYNTMTGTYTDTTGRGFCVIISAYDRDSETICYQEYCISDLPRCDCLTEIEICKIECAGIDPETEYPWYYFETCFDSPIDQSVVFNSNMGTISGQTSLQLSQGLNTIGAYFVPYNTNDTIMCIEYILVHNQGGVLVDYTCNRCIALPVCQEPAPCDEPVVTITGANCRGTSGNGSFYDVFFNVSNPPVNCYIELQSTTGIVNSHTALSYGSTNATFKASYNHTTSNLLACFIINFYSIYDSTFQCYENVCDSLPGCSAVPVADSCNVSRTAEWTYCVGTDINGNRLYLFEASVTTPIAYEIYPYTTAGGIYLPVMQLDTGYNQLIGLFIDSSPFDTAMTITVNSFDQDSQTLCYFNIDFDSIAVCSPVRFSAPGYLKEKNYSVPILQLIPNPAKESTSIVYRFNDEEENRVMIIDMQGRVISRYDKLKMTGALQYSTADLPNGIYFVVAQSKNNLRLAEKLVIIK